MARHRTPHHVWCSLRGLAGDTGYSVQSLPNARKRARVLVHARLHLAVLQGRSLDEAGPDAPVRLTRDMRGKDRWDYRHMEETWGPTLTGAGRWEVVRIVPGPLLVKRKATAPKPKEGKPVLVPATNLKTAWDLGWIMEPSHAVLLVEHARKVLGSPDKTRQWFQEGMGGSSLSFLLDLFWPQRTELGGTGNWDRDPRRWGYKVAPDSLEALFKRLLRALGRNDWNRAAAMLVQTSLRTSYQSMRKGVQKKDGTWTERRIVKKSATIQNGRVICLRGASSANRARKPEGLASLLDYGFKPANTPSVVQLMELRVLITRNMRQARRDRLLMLAINEGKHMELAG